MRLYDILKDLYAFPTGSQQPYDNLIWVFLMWAWLIIVSWVLDIASLLKKKSPRETMAVMALPGCVAFVAGILSAILLGVTSDKKMLLKELPVFLERETCREMLGTALVYLALWLTAVKMRGRKNDTWKRKLFWAVSYLPDLVTAGVLLLLSLTMLTPTGASFREDLLEYAKSSSEILPFLIWLFVYGIQQLLIRMLLLLTVVIAKLASVRIPLGKFPAGGHPRWRIFVYAAFCQNAYVRGVLTLALPAGFFFSLLVLFIWRQEPSPVVLPFLSLLYSTAALYIMITLRPAVQTLRGFSAWGDQKFMAEQFCREFFNEKPVFRSVHFTVTTHYLVDERSVAEIFYLEKLETWSFVTVLPGDNVTVSSRQAYTVDKAERSGWEWIIRFSDGRVCCIEKEDGDVNKILGILGQYKELQRLNAGAPQVPPRKTPAREGVFDILFRAVVIWVAVSFMLLTTFCTDTL